MIPALVVILSLILWLLSARLNYRMMVSNGWMTSVDMGGGSHTKCIYYYKQWHPVSNCCEHCAEWKRENFKASTRNRICWSLLLGPLLAIGLGTGTGVKAIITGKQPLSVSEREHRLAEAEKALIAANKAMKEAQNG